MCPLAVWLGPLKVSRSGRLPMPRFPKRIAWSIPQTLNVWCIYLHLPPKITQMYVNRSYIVSLGTCIVTEVVYDMQDISEMRIVWLRAFSNFRSSARCVAVRTQTLSTRLGKCKVCYEAVHCEEEKVVELLKHCKKLVIKLYPEIYNIYIYTVENWWNMMASVMPRCPMSQCQ